MIRVFSTVLFMPQLFCVPVITVARITNTGEALDTLNTARYQPRTDETAALWLDRFCGRPGYRNKPDQLNDMAIHMGALTGAA